MPPEGRNSERLPPPVHKCVILWIAESKNLAFLVYLGILMQLENKIMYIYTHVKRHNSQNCTKKFLSLFLTNIK